ncbi:rhodanese-like domain-containing protein [Chitinophaga oryziterrae]|uniref:Rhodanese-like domain-containing protein n=1 Tax=Chitinophaga oryziterrae TaxID=1031224 RepID=A0A6N8JHB5_9BACT|nr:rhodanese-like domain-containing protein [Chitinophaga oryziterrae]MVT43542.1 rhodanese-like domain-containing protein [Chitinophaga oryziterrae]
MNFFKQLFSGSPAIDLANVIKDGAFLVDVRTSAEFANGHVKGSVNIPLDQVASQLSRFKDKKNIIVFCQSGGRSSQAKSILERNGFNNVINGGSWNNVAKYCQA